MDAEVFPEAVDHEVLALHPGGLFGTENVVGVG
jgi:hypothetical protein